MSEASREMPKYDCHKQVHALKIAIIETDESGGYLIPEENGYAPIRVDASYLRRNLPEIDGYYVVYKDGYKSYSPAQAFEEGYTEASDDPEQEAPDGETSQAEAIDGFVNWLATRAHKSVISRTHGCGHMQHLIDAYCEANEFAPAKLGYRSENPSKDI